MIKKLNITVSMVWPLSYLLLRTQGISLSLATLGQLKVSRFKGGVLIFRGTCVLFLLCMVAGTMHSESWFKMRSGISTTMYVHYTEHLSSHMS